MNERALHESIGWLVSAVSADHPGYLAALAERARDENPHVAATLDDWHQRLGAPTYVPEIAWHRVIDALAGALVRVRASNDEADFLTSDEARQVDDALALHDRRLMRDGGSSGGAGLTPSPSTGHGTCTPTPTLSDDATRQGGE